jgi:hypothetical protein
MDATDLARSFKGPHKARVQRITAILQGLARYGDATPTPDGRFLARLAA